jgi:Na+-translocating ferredoxin:NAD+ oxidoreductase subunit B
MHIEIAKNVIEHLRKFPFGFPSSPDKDEWKLFEVPFSLTDEEGELLIYLMPYSEHVDDIAKRLGRKKEDILPVLDGLLHKTWLLRTGTRENGRYTAMTWGPGAMELQMPWLTKEILELYGKAGQLDQQYEPTELIPHYRVIPRESAIPNTTEVLPSEVVSHLIEQADDNEIAVTECLCRKMEKIHGRGCSAPIDDQCLFLGAFATTIVEINAGRRISKEDAKKRIKRAQDLGLVHQTNANARPLAICSCCTCCCGTLRPLLAGRPQPSFKSNFYSTVNVEVCKGTCPECVKVCPAKACTIDKKTQRPVIDLSRCIGCGLCVVACPEKALTLGRKEKPYVYPDTWDDYLAVRARQSGRDTFFKK